MSNTQKKQAKRKARKKERPKAQGPTVAAIAKATGHSVEDVKKALVTLREKKIIKPNGAGRAVVSDEAAISMALHEATGIFVDPAEV